MNEDVLKIINSLSTNPTTLEDKINAILKELYLYGYTSAKHQERGDEIEGITQGEARHALLALVNEAESMARLNLIGYYQQVGSNENMNWMGLFADNEQLVRDELAQLRAATPKENI